MGDGGVRVGGCDSDDKYSSTSATIFFPPSLSIYPSISLSLSYRCLPLTHLSVPVSVFSTDPKPHIWTSNADALCPNQPWRSSRSWCPQLPRRRCGCALGTTPSSESNSLHSAFLERRWH